MNGIWKTFFIYLPFIILLMVFYWMINEVEINYPTIAVNNHEVIYGINYKYKTTLIPFIYDFTKEGRNSSYDGKTENALAKKVSRNNQVLVNVSGLDYDITNMYIVYEGTSLKQIYDGEFISDISSYISEPGVYRISLYCKLHKFLYYDGFVDYKFKIEVA